MTRLPAILTLCLFAVSLAGCLGTTPNEEARAALGPWPGEGDEEHRIGQPCLLCHGPDSGGEASFVLAGTVFLRAEDSIGVPGVDVEVTDSSGRTFIARTNRVGNFMVSARGHGGEDEGDEPGWISLDFDPDFPLSVTVRSATTEQSMTSLIQREGSCATCHSPEIGAASVGRVYLEEP